MALEKKYWKSFQELEDGKLAEEMASKEFQEQIPVEDFLSDKESLESSKTSRRDFLKYMGFSTAAASLAACTPGIKHVIPYVNKPDDVTPGVATFYATSIFNGLDFSSILVKNREGRPIKVEPNKESKHFATTNARVQASVLSMYDMDRLRAPEKKGKSTSWSTVLKAFKTSIETDIKKGKKSVLVTPTIISPTVRAQFAQLAKKYSSCVHVPYDAISSSSLIEAANEVYGKNELPYYSLDNSDYIVSFGADIIGDWKSNNLEQAYAARRKPSKSMLQHKQVEANMSLSGSNADYRIPMSTADQEQAIAYIYSILSNSSISVSLTDTQKKRMKGIAADLKNHGSKAVIVTESDKKEVQVLALLINDMIKSNSIDFRGFRIKSDHSAINELLADLKAGKVGTLAMYGVNPAYTLPASAKFNALIKKADKTFSFTIKKDETAALVDVVAPISHNLEAWADYQPFDGAYFLAQPTINKLFDSKSLIEIANYLIGSSKSAYETIRAYWESKVISPFSWNQALHDGFKYTDIKPAKPVAKFAGSISTLISVATKKSKGIELNLYTKTTIGDGVDVNNPWLQETPDPVTKSSYDNYLTMSKKMADEMGLTNYHVSNGAMNGSLVTLKANGVTLNNVPVLIQPGQATNTVGLALGYGRKAAGKLANGLGIDAYALYSNFTKSISNVSITKAEGEHELASIQLQHTMMGRDIVRETTLKDFIHKPKSEWNPEVDLATHKGVKPVKEVTVWSNHDYKSGHYFNMSIDLTTCTGCAACVVSCHLENNVPVVGKDEIRMSRDMHWLRIDRYYSSDMTVERAKEEGLDKGLFNNIDMFHQMEEPAETNPEVVFQPVMCQHCNNAPCETVCPVAATSHSTQGQNNMAYNRCVGTRYCLNNCPYKVRRFNWFKYFANDQFDFHMNNDLGRMVLNPDVVVRSRGVMEKCSLCLQRTQATILEAKNEGREVNPDAFHTACSSACSTGAIKFGDLNNEKDEIATLYNDDRKYYLLEHVGAKPNVFYQVKVRNK